MVSCDGPSCCVHDITRTVMRDGVQHSICLCCGLEVDADDMPVVDTVPNLVSPAIPCCDVAHKWGWL